MGSAAQGTMHSPAALESALGMTSQAIDAYLLLSSRASRAPRNHLAVESDSLDAGCQRAGITTTSMGCVVQGVR